MNPDETEQLPPHDPYHERGAIACILWEPRPNLDDCERLGVNPEWFFILKNREIFIGAVGLRGEPCAESAATFAHELGKRIKGTTTAELCALWDWCPTSTLLEDFLAVVREKWLLRLLSKTHRQISEDALAPGADLESLFSDSEKASIAMSETYMASKAGGVTRIMSPEAGAADTLNDIETRFDLHKKNELSGVETGFYKFDDMTGGLQLGELAVIAARPSQGKTALACSIAHHVAYTRGETIVFVTLEMSPKALGRRLASISQSIPASNIRKGRLEERDMPKLVSALGSQRRARIYWVNGVAGMTCDQIERDVKSLLRMHQIRLVIVDYLQKIRPTQKHEKRTYEVGAISGSLKGLASSMNVAMLCLAQLNRDPDKDKGRAPRVSDLADSAQIERDADLIAMIHRPGGKDDPEASQAELIIGKQRDGETGMVHLTFLSKYARFESAARVNEQDVPGDYQPQTNDP